MHGGPSADHFTLLPFRQLADRFTLIFYDHRCNGRSAGAPVSSMTWENLAADAEALRQELGFERWAVLGHSFGGMVALEYALRYPASPSHLVLLDTGGDSWWPQQNTAGLLTRRGCRPKKAELVRRWENGEFTRREYLPIALRVGDVYCHGSFLRLIIRDAIGGQWRQKLRPEAWIFAGRELWKGWTVMDRLGEISVPTMVMAGRDDIFFPQSTRASWRRASPAHACRSSSTPVTSRTPSSPPRSWRPSQTSSPQTRRQPDHRPAASPSARRPGSRPGSAVRREVAYCWCACLALARRAGA
jgi:pimeloyl-ACP methyl ester carboxylesterase